MEKIETIEKEKRGKKSVYSVGIYARISVEHKIKKESIASQIAIAKAYIEQQGEMDLYNCYIDLGESGTHFKRNGFLKLMEDIRTNRVNCVIVKDFSRFGRNYIEVENYIDKIFPFLGVRFISVADEFDSLYQGEKEFDRNLKNLINEIYANDTAKKVKEVKQFYREQGNYLGSKAPYGYQIERRGGKRVLIEGAAFEIAEKIMQLFLEGKNKREIAIWLYQNRVHRPSDYRYTGHIYCTEKETLFEWQKGSIQQILNRQLLMHQGKTMALKNRSFLKEKAALKEKGILKEKQNCLIEKKNRDLKIWKGICYCGDCHQELVFRNDLKKGIFYCKQAGRIDIFRCSKKQITEEKLCFCMKILLENLLRKKKFVVFDDAGKKELEKRSENSIRKRRKKQETAIKRIEQQIAAGKRIVSENYVDYQLKKIEKEEFLIKKKVKKEKIKKLEEEKQKVLQQLQKTEKQQIELMKWMEKVAEGQIEQIKDSFFFLFIIKRVELFCGKRILIQFHISKERQEFMNGQNME